ncbi:MAG TPA: glycosyltransferase [Gammaproteobacteria bacterium]|nr:glycosyltransferase [Gammaproteobacteria bacterium]
MTTRTKIPRHFHFVFGMRPQEEPFHLVYYLCLESCLQVNRPERISVYYHYEPYGPWWNRIRDRIDTVHVPLNELVTNMEYSNRHIGRKLRYAHHADFVRVEKLLEHGGVYADMDTLFLRPLAKDLFNHSFVLGREKRVTDPRTGESWESLCNAFIMSEPGAEFARIWLERMHDVFNGNWSDHSCKLAQILSEECPQHIHVEAPSSFYPYMWTREDLCSLFEECHENWNGAYSVHLWNHLWWSSKKTNYSTISGKKLTERYIRKVDTTYTIAARRFLPPQKNLFKQLHNRVSSMIALGGNT